MLVAPFPSSSSSSSSDFELVAVGVKSEVVVATPYNHLSGECLNSNEALDLMIFGGVVDDKEMIVVQIQELDESQF